MALGSAPFWVWADDSLCPASSPLSRHNEKKKKKKGNLGFSFVTPRASSSCQRKDLIFPKVMIYSSSPAQTATYISRRINWKARWESQWPKRSYFRTPRRQYNWIKFRLFLSLSLSWQQRQQKKSQRHNRFPPSVTAVPSRPAANGHRGKEISAGSIVSFLSCLDSSISLV